MKKLILLLSVFIYSLGFSQSTYNVITNATQAGLKTAVQTFLTTNPTYCVVGGIGINSNSYTQVVSNQCTVTPTPAPTGTANVSVVNNLTPSTSGNQTIATGLLTTLSALESSINSKITTVNTNSVTVVSMPTVSVNVINTIPTHTVVVSSMPTVFSGSVTISGSPNVSVINTILTHTVIVSSMPTVVSISGALPAGAATLGAVQVLGIPTVSQGYATSALQGTINTSIGTTNTRLNTGNASLASIDAQTTATAANTAAIGAAQVSYQNNYSLGNVGNLTIASVRNDARATSFSTDQYYTPVAVDINGATFINATSGVGTETITSSLVTDDNTIATGAYSIGFTTSSDFSGNINGVARAASTFYGFKSDQGRKLPAIAYTTTTGSINIDEIR